MAKRGTSARATWLPATTADSIRKRGYSGYSEACEANGIKHQSLKKLYESPPPGLLNVVKLAQDLAQGDPRLAWEIVTELAGQIGNSGDIIVPVDSKKMQEKPSAKVQEKPIFQKGLLLGNMSYRQSA